MVIGLFDAAAITTRARWRSGWALASSRAITPPTPWPTTTVLSAFCLASTRSSAAAAATSVNDSGIGLSPCPGRSTSTTR